MEVETKKGYKKTKLGWIPEEWKIKTLSSISKIERGKFSPRPRNDPRFYNGSIPFVQTSDVSQSSGIIQSHSQTLNEEGLKVSKLFKEGTILMTIASNIGHTAILKYDMACPDSLIGLTVNKDFDTPFLNYFFQSKRKNIEYIAPGAQKNINVEFLKPYPIITPCLQEQKAISTCLNTWDKNIKSFTDLIKEKELQKKGLMQQLLTGKTHLKGFGSKWKEDKLGNYFSERKETGLVNLDLLSIGEAGVYPQSNSNKKDTSNNDKSKYKRICVGDIGYNTMRMWQGRSALSGLEGMVSPAYTIVTPLKDADSIFFSYLFKLDEMIHKFYRNSQGMVSDTWMCKYKDFKIVKFNAPPTREEQTAIANVLQQADKEIALLNLKLDKLKEQKKGLMQQLLTGKKRLKF
ncbi:restriction endonuclease subunit S [Winogradskyella undariae]|uniref:restriction endonuclease subunit S n=1 Tax=Winogradskyella undariae TaxID=1285465 RepID=UPI0015CB7A38|nr:restriction endonuclease subunit S [Winogradskyella undariae]